MGFLELLRAHYAELLRLAHTSAMATFAPALTPMLATLPARVFAATNMLVLVVLLLLLCSEPLFPLCSGTVSFHWCGVGLTPTNSCDMEFIELQASEHPMMVFQSCE